MCPTVPARSGRERVEETKKAPSKDRGTNVGLETKPVSEEIREGQGDAIESERVSTPPPFSKGLWACPERRRAGVPDRELPSVRAYEWGHRGARGRDEARPRWSLVSGTLKRRVGGRLDGAAWEKESRFGVIW